jgi:hypothetical protein
MLVNGAMWETSGNNNLACKVALEPWLLLDDSVIYVSDRATVYVSGASLLKLNI